MTATARLLLSLEFVTNEARAMLAVLDEAAGVRPADRLEAKRRVLEIRARTQELFDWLSEARLEEQLN